MKRISFDLLATDNFERNVFPLSTLLLKTIFTGDVARAGLEYEVLETTLLKLILEDHPLQLGASISGRLSDALWKGRYDWDVITEGEL